MIIKNTNKLLKILFLLSAFAFGINSFAQNKEINFTITVNPTLIQAGEVFSLIIEAESPYSEYVTANIRQDDETYSFVEMQVRPISIKKDTGTEKATRIECIFVAKNVSELTIPSIRFNIKDSYFVVSAQSFKVYGVINKAIQKEKKAYWNLPEKNYYVGQPILLDIITDDGEKITSYEFSSSDRLILDRVTNNSTIQFLVTTLHTSAKLPKGLVYSGKTTYLLSELILNTLQAPTFLNKPILFGDFTLESKLENTDFSLEKTLVFSLSLKGSGNFPCLQIPSLSLKDSNGNTLPVNFHVSRSDFWKPNENTYTGHINFVFSLDQENLKKLKAREYTLFYPSLSTLNSKNEQSSLPSFSKKVRFLEQKIIAPEIKVNTKPTLPFLKYPELTKISELFTKGKKANALQEVLKIERSKNKALQNNAHELREYFELSLRNEIGQDVFPKLIEWPFIVISLILFLLTIAFLLLFTIPKRTRNQVPLHKKRMKYFLTFIFTFILTILSIGSTLFISIENQKKYVVVNSPALFKIPSKNGQIISKDSLYSRGLVLAILKDWVQIELYDGTSAWLPLDKALFY